MSMMRKILILLSLLAVVANSQAWYLVGGRILPANRFYTVDLRRGGLGTGFVVGYFNPASPDPGSLRFNIGELQYYNGASWQTLSYGGATTSFTKQQIDTVGTVASGVWQGSSIDTAYTNAVAHLTAKLPIVALRYNSKDFQISADTSTRFTGLTTDNDRIQDSLVHVASIATKKDKSDTTAATGYARNWDTPSLVESNTFSSGTTQTMPRASIDTLDVGSVILRTSAGLSIRKATIQTAINDADSGDLVLVYPGTYTENLTLPDTGITVKGIDRNTVVIDGRLIVTGKSNTIMGVGITDTLQIKCYAPYDSTIMERNAIIDCTLSGDVFVGAVADSNISGVYFENCFFNGDGKTFLINHVGSWRNRIYLNNCYTQNYVDSSSWRFNNMIVYGDATVSFNNCKYFVVQSILLDAQKGLAAVELANFGQFVIDYGGLSGVNNSVNWTVFTAFSGYSLHGDRRAGSTWTLDGKFEFNIWNTRFGMPDVVFNSVANSRWEQVTQIGYQSSKTLSGTGLSVLYITNSIFRMSKPTGLGGNAGTRWEAFIDD